MLTFKHYIIYQISCIETGKLYIGYDSKNDPNYLGSGTNIKALISERKKAGVKFPYNLKKTILHVFNSSEEAFNKEAELVNEDFLKKPEVLNIVLGGGNFTATGKTAMKDIDGKIHFLNIDDHRIKTNEFSHINTGRVCVVDKYDNKFIVTKEEFYKRKGIDFESIHKYKTISTETRKILSEINIGKVSPNKGVKLSSETKKRISNSSIGSKRSISHRQNISKANKNLTTAKDKHGNKFRVYSNDVRFITKELYGIASKLYKLTFSNGTEIFTRDLSKTIKDLNMPCFKVINRFIDTGIITYKVRKNSTKFDINGMTIENLEW